MIYDTFWPDDKEEDLIYIRIKGILINLLKKNIYIIRMSIYGDDSIIFNHYESFVIPIDVLNPACRFFFVICCSKWYENAHLRVTSFYLWSWYKLGCTSLP